MAADVSPKGDHPGFIQVLDDVTVAIPDRPGNNRLDGYENILANPAVGLIFLIPGINETFRINGTGEIRDDEDLLARFEMSGKLPRTCLVVTVAGSLHALRQGLYAIPPVGPRGPRAARHSADRGANDARPDRRPDHQPTKPPKKRPPATKRCFTEPPLTRPARQLIQALVGNHRPHHNHDDHEDQKRVAVIIAFAG